MKSNNSVGAKLSPCRAYRYSLWREWDAEKGTCVFIGLNPSTADESADDPTIRRCINFARSWGAGRLVMINLFAFRATEPANMKRALDPIGGENDKHLMNECSRASLVVAAWGNHGSYLGRDKAVLSLLNNIKMKCFKKTKQGQPAHPLYQPSDSILINLVQ